MIEVFTDMSLRGKTAIVTCLVKTDSSFLGFKTFEYYNVNTSVYGELLGIRDGIRYLKSVVKNPQEEINLYSDAQWALDQIHGTAAELKHKRLVSTIVRDGSEMNINFIYMKAHQEECNPNKVVDGVSKAVLQYKVPEKNRRR